MRDALTEAEARDRWCPFGRLGVHFGEAGACAVNQGREANTGAPCKASDCMAWRWAGWETKTSGWLAPNPEPDDRVGERRGFCGLAGAPR